MNFRLPTARDWVGIGSFLLTVMVIWMMAAYRDLREDEFFQTIATAIIISGFLNGPVSWAYGATRVGGELADRNAAIVERHVEENKT